MAQDRIGQPVKKFNSSTIKAETIVFGRKRRMASLNSDSKILHDLIRKEELFHFIDELKMGVFLFNSAGKSLLANDHFLHMFGYTLEELKNKPLNALFDEPSVALLKDYKNELSNLYGKTKGQDQLYLKMIFYKKLDQTNTLIILLNITEDKRREEQLADTSITSKNLMYAIDQSATVSITDIKGNIIYVNDRFCQVSKYTKEELIGQNHRIVKSDYHPKEFYAEMWKTIQKGEIWRGEVCNKAKDGTIWWGGATIVPFLNEKGEPYQYLAIRSDITEQKKLEEKLRKSAEQIRLNERKFKSLIFHSYDVIAILNNEGIIEYISPNYVELSDLKEEEILGFHSKFFLHVDDRQKFEYAFQKVLEEAERSETLEVRVQNKTGNWRYFELVLTNLLNDDAVNGIVAYYRDINEKKKAADQIYKMAYYDFLTQLPNRRKLISLLESAIKIAKNKNKKFSLMVLDLHGLKFVNDLLGTHVGDRLLQKAAVRMVQNIGKRGIVFRTDGDEFAVILPNVSSEQTHQIASGVIEAINEPFTINKYELFLAINIGISVYPDSGLDLNDLQKNAYSAMHASKSVGRNCYQIFSKNLNEGSYKRFLLKNDLRKALDNDEFFLQFQPRIDPVTNEIIGAEALIRWNHPKYGLISPLEFIPLAEEEGLIGTIGERVLLEACRLNKKWQDEGLPPIVVSVNFSAIQFLQADMIEMVERILEETGLDPKWLEIEITESALMKDKSTVLKKIEDLKKMGITTAIDDFGTGYASLSYLKNIKANTLKIDRSFINGIPFEPDSAEIVSSIIRLAQKLMIRTVAEGVEKMEQLKVLRDIEVDEIQGYLFSKPLPVKQFESLLSKKVCPPNNKDD